jgi:hypothetical protein
MFGIIVLWFIGRGFASACNQDEAKRMCRLKRPRMRFLISPKTAVCWFLLSARIRIEETSCSMKMGGYIVVLVEVRDRNAYQDKIIQSTWTRTID